MNEKSLAKGLAPLTLVAPLIALALVMTIAFVGWLTGFWSSIISKEEKLRILPDSSIEIADSRIYLKLHVVNDCGSIVNIVGVEVSEARCRIATEFPLNPYEYKTVVIPLTGIECKVVPGNTYTVIVFTSQGNEYQTVVTAK